ncbi:S41 family peptidase [Niabella sp. W65]|nr:S41 family peptidase [Niabella sp. W65]MCH7363522.1 S41 family peptidase [Niabella sp. W65]
MRILIVAIIAISFISCKKDPVTPKPDPDPTPNPPVNDTRSYQQRLSDSLFKLAQQVYYWNTQIPDSASFKPLGYANSDTLNGLNAELLAITRTNTFEGTGTSAKYSYLVKTSDLYDGGSIANAITDQGKVGEMKMTLDGKENDLGFTLGIVPVYYSAVNTVDSIPYIKRDSSVVYVRKVTNGSPAYKAGLRRGDVVANAELDYGKYGATPLNNLLNGSSAKLIVYKTKTKTRDTLATFTKAVYTFNPVLKDTVVTVAGKKIAYMAYESFTTGTNSQPALDASFSKFSGATDIVVDLRHNGGGYVDVAKYLINLLAPQSAQGKMAFAEYYTATMVNKQATLLKTQPVYLNNVRQNYSYYDIDYSVSENTTNVNKRGSFNSSNNIPTIYFIVSKSTASASELVINSLKPYYNVVLIGAAFSDNGTLTYGKPIGFFELRLGKYSVFLSSFETKNAQGTGGYFTGMSTNYQAFDDVRFDFGDPNEICFLRAIRLITGLSTYLPGSTSASASTSTVGRSVYSSTPQNMTGTAIGDVSSVSGMIATPQK